jgi:hypothetical protein
VVVNGKKAIKMIEKEDVEEGEVVVAGLIMDVRLPLHHISHHLSMLQ